MKIACRFVAAWVLTSFSLVDAQAADKVSLSGRLMSAPLPIELKIQKPGADIPQGFAAFVGAWGLVPSQRARAHVLVVTRVTATGKADVIYSMGTSPRFDPFYAEWSGTIKGDTLTVPATRGAVVTYRHTGNTLHTVWKRGDNSFSWDMNKLKVISELPQSDLITASSTSGIQKDLASLKSLFDQDLITARQFQNKRQNLLDKVFSPSLDTKQNLSIRISPREPPKPVSTNINFGRYHALVIGINAYYNLNP